MLNSNDTIAMVSIILSAKWIPSGSLRNGLMALIIIIHRSSSAIVQCSKSLPYALWCLRSIPINRIYTHTQHIIFSFIGIGNTWHMSTRIYTSIYKRVGILLLFSPRIFLCFRFCYSVAQTTHITPREWENNTLRLMFITPWSQGYQHRQ